MKYDTIYGMQIIPEKDENGCKFGRFEGVVIYSSIIGSDIQIALMDNTNFGYVSKVSKSISYIEIIEADFFSGEELFDYIIAKAQAFANYQNLGEYQLAISQNLVNYINSLDKLYNEKRHYRKCNKTNDKTGK